MRTVCNVCKTIIAPSGAVIVGDAHAEWKQLFPAIAVHYGNHHPDLVATLERLADSFMAYALSRLTISTDPSFLAMQRFEASTIWTIIASEYDGTELSTAPNEGRGKLPN